MLTRSAEPNRNEFEMRLMKVKSAVFMLWLFDNVDMTSLNCTAGWFCFGALVLCFVAGCCGQFVCCLCFFCYCGDLRDIKKHHSE